LPLKRGSLSSSATGSALIAVPFRRRAAEDVRMRASIAA
jgi:hypothetical protein